MAHESVSSTQTYTFFATASEMFCGWTICAVCQTRKDCDTLRSQSALRTASADDDDDDDDDWRGRVHLFLRAYSRRLRKVLVQQCNLIAVYKHTHTRRDTLQTHVDNDTLGHAVKKKDRERKRQRDGFYVHTFHAYSTLYVCKHVYGDFHGTMLKLCCSVFAVGAMRLCTGHAMHSDLWTIRSATICQRVSVLPTSADESNDNQMWRIIQKIQFFKGY